MLDLNALARILPRRVRNAIDAHLEAIDVVREIRNPRVLMSLAPAAVRGLMLHRGKQGVPTHIRASHMAHFDWSYPADQPEMRRLYDKAKRGQWDSASLAWSTDVDPLNPEVPLLPERFIDFPKLESMGVKLGASERRAVIHDVMSWSLSQFLHGEQG